MSHLHLRRLLRIKSELHEIYLNQIIFFFTLSLIGVFIPIYLINLGFGLNFTLAFLAAFFLGLGLFSPYGSSIASRIGMKKAILLRLPFFFVYYGFLFSLQYFTLPYLAVFFIGFFGGAVDALYWNPLHTEFVRNSDKIHRGEETGHLIGSPMIGQILGPTIGAILLTYLGFPPVFILVMFLMGVSVVPLLGTRDRVRKHTFSLKKVKFFLKNKLHWAFMSQGFLHFSESIMWPLWIFYTFQNLLNVGVAMTVVALSILFVTLIEGRISDRVNKHRMMKIGGFFYFLVWIARFFASTYLEVLLLSFLGGLFYTTIRIPLYSRFCNAAGKKDIIPYVTSREMWIGVGRVLSALIILLVLIKFHTGFALGALAALVFIFI